MSFFLTGTSWDANNAAVIQEHMGGLSGDSTGSTVSHMFLFLVVQTSGFSFLVATGEHSCRTGKREKWEAGKWRTQIY